jgi:hypothetical protein
MISADFFLEGRGKRESRRGKDFFLRFSFGCFNGRAFRCDGSERENILGTRHLEAALFERALVYAIGRVSSGMHRLKISPLEGLGAFIEKCGRSRGRSQYSQ